MLHTTETTYASNQTEFHYVINSLQRAGEMAAIARRKGVSLNVLSRLFILEARRMATLYGLSYQMIAHVENEGAGAVRP